jgi:hypothetical protein
VLLTFLSESTANHFCLFNLTEKLLFDNLSVEGNCEFVVFTLMQMCASEVVRAYLLADKNMLHKVGDIGRVITDLQLWLSFVRVLIRDIDFDIY